MLRRSIQMVISSLFFGVFILFIGITSLVTSGQEVSPLEQAPSLSWDEVMKLPVTQSGTSYQIEMSNESVEAKPNGVYIASFSLKSDQSIADGAFSFDIRSDQSQEIMSAVPVTQPFSIVANQEKQFSVTIRPTLPKPQEGESYKLYLTVINAIGVRVLEASLGMVSIQNNVTLYSLRDCTFVEVSGEKTKSFLPRQGVDVAIGENLPLSCWIEGAVPEDGSVLPIVTWYERNYQTGIKKIDKTFDQKSFVRGGNKTILNLDVTSVPQEPQAYDAVIVLKNATGELVSNEIAMHFVVRGASATIQSIKTDKLEYSTNDIAKIDLLISGPADNFPQARGERTRLENVTFQVRLTDDVKQLCGEVKQSIDFEKSLENTVSIPITMDCFYPTITVTVYDGADVLAERSIDLGSIKSEDISAIENTNSKTKSIYTIGFFVFLFLVLIAIIVMIFVFKRGRGGRGLSISILFIILLGFGSFFSITPVYAGQMSGGPNFLHGTDDQDTQGYYSYYMSYPGNSIEPGEFIKVWYNWQYTGCSNEYHAINWTPYSSWGAGVSSVLAGTRYTSSCRTCLASDQQCSYQFVSTPYPHWENVCVDTCTEYSFPYYFSQMGSWPNPGSPWECTHEWSAPVYDKGFYASAPGTYFIRHYFTLPGNSATHDQWFNVACPSGKTWNGSSCVALVNGSCGTSNGGSFTDPPSSGLCSAGTASARYWDGWRWYWTCAGSNGGSNATCVAYPIPKGGTSVTRCDYLNAWTCDASNFSQALDVHVYDGAGFSKYVGQFKADQYWGNSTWNAGMVCGGYPNHGRSWPIPDALKTGDPHTAKMYAINIGSGGWNPSIGSQTVDCVPPVTNLTATCSADGTQATFSWNAKYPAKTTYNIRMDKQDGTWYYGAGGRTCPYPTGAPVNYLGDYCGNINTTSYTVPVTPGASNNFWVHAYSGGAGTSAQVSTTITCNNTPPVPSCTGTVPANATLCTGDSAGLTVNTPRVLIAGTAASCGAPKCEYYCSSGYSNISGTCQPTPIPTANLGVAVNSGGFSYSPTTSTATVNAVEGDTLKFAWGSSGVTACTLTGFGITGGANGTTKSETSPVLVTASQSADYTLACSGSYGSVTDVIRVNLSCSLGNWSTWSTCDKECGTGQQSRSRKKTDCTYEYEYQDCNTQSCNPTGFKEVNP